MEVIFLQVIIVQSAFLFLEAIIGYLYHCKASSNNHTSNSWGIGPGIAKTLWISAHDVERSLPAWEDEIDILRPLCPMAGRILRSKDTEPTLTSNFRLVNRCSCQEKYGKVYKNHHPKIWISEKHFRSKSTADFGNVVPKLLS